MITDLSTLRVRELRCSVLVGAPVAQMLAGTRPAAVFLQFLLGGYSDAEPQRK